ncbi:hypothetical protein OH77DRAFT_859903 [Trametes cingulata]|nr:hypothetical protein OH77DRAFT_859903 [Trametes cingulata]
MLIPCNSELRSTEQQHQPVSHRTTSPAPMRLRGEYTRSSSPESGLAPYTPHRPDSSAQLALAYAQIDMLRDQVKHLKTIQRLQNDRIEELQTELFDATHMLDPAEESQVLLEIPQRRAKRPAGEGHMLGHARTGCGPSHGTNTGTSSPGSHPASRAKKSRHI